MPGITYTNEPIKCFKCNYLLTVIRSNPECKESKTKIYCQISGCPMGVMRYAQIPKKQPETAKDKIDNCIKMLKRCIENKYKSQNFSNENNKLNEEYTKK